MQIKIVCVWLVVWKTKWIIQEKECVTRNQLIKKSPKPKSRAVKNILLWIRFAKAQAGLSKKILNRDGMACKQIKHLSQAWLVLESKLHIYIYIYIQTELGLGNKESGISKLGLAWAQT